ncbi:extracellular solute-binding protein [bacterium D16-50]|nr:extracellular solute-binding protein [bacterium D16-50]
MRKNRIPIICFGILALFLWGCGKTPDSPKAQPSDTGPQKEQTENVSKTLPDGYVLSASFEDAGGDTRTYHDILHSTYLVGDSLYYYYSEFDRKQNKVVTEVYLQERGKEARLLNLSAEEGSRLYTAAAGEDGCLYLLYHKSDENGDIKSYTLEKRDENLQLVYSVDTTAGLKQASADPNVYINFMEADADGKLYGLTLKGLVVCWDETGVYQGCTSLPVNPAETLTRGLVNAGSDGVYAYWSGLDEKKKSFVHLYDLNKWLGMKEDEQKDAVPLQLDLSSVPESTSIGSEKLFLFSGYGEGAYLADQNRLWQIDLSDGSIEPLLVWQDAYLRAGYVREIRRREDGGFLLYIFDSMEQENYWVDLNPIPAHELPEKIELVLGVAGREGANSETVTNKIDRLVLSYNRTHPYCHVTIKEYAAGSVTDLQLELISGKGPDILMERESFFDMETLMSKGAVEDLAPYLAGGGELSGEDILPGILELIKKDGRISRIPLTFSAGIMILPKDRPQEFMTPEETVEFMTQDDDGYVDQLIRPASFLLQILSGGEIDQYADAQSKTCSFDSHEFVSLLEQMNKLRDMKTTQRPWERLEPFLSGQIKAYVDELGSMEDYLCIRETFFDIWEITGFPNSERELRYPAHLYDWLGMNSASQHKDEAWSFIEFCLSYATRFSNTSDRFVVTSDAFSRQSHHDYENSIDVMGPALFDGGGTTRFDSTTQEETDFLWEMTKHLYLYEDSNLLRVISEESKAYFGGDISAQEAAERIQNRASLVLGE